MATLDLVIGGTSGVSEKSARKHILFANTIDFSVTANNMVATDVAQLFNIPLGFFMTACGARVDTAQGATATATFGDGADPNGWMATFDLNGAVDTYTASLPGDAYPALGGKYYDAADTFDLVAGHTFDAAVITVWAEGYMIEADYTIPPV